MWAFPSTFDGISLFLVLFPSWVWMTYLRGCNRQVVFKQSMLYSLKVWLSIPIRVSDYRFCAWSQFYPVFSRFKYSAHHCSSWWTTCSCREMIISFSQLWFGFIKFSMFSWFRRSISKSDRRLTCCSLPTWRSSTQVVLMYFVFRLILRISTHSGEFKLILLGWSQ